MVKRLTLNECCSICGATTMNSYLCVRCEGNLNEIVIRAGITQDTDNGTELCILDELDVQLSRQARQAARAGGRSAETPLPFDSRASNAHTALADRLTNWARHYGAAVNVLAGPRRCAVWLRSHLYLIIMSADVEDMYWELENANTRALTVIDRPESKDYIGICSAMTDIGICTTDLYASQDSPSLTCSQCGAVHDVQSRRDIMLKAAEEVLLSGIDIARMASIMGAHVSAAQIYKWRFRGRLLSRGNNIEGRPVYRLGDVLELARRRGLHSR